MSMRARADVVSPLRYPGGKSWLVPLMRRWLSLHPRRKLIEPFAGGASVSIAAVAEGLLTQAIISDADARIACFSQVVLSDDAHRLISAVSSFPVNEDTARDRLAAAATSSGEVAFQTLLRNRLARGGLLAGSSGLLRRGEDDRGLFSRWYPQTLADRCSVAQLSDGRCTGLLANHSRRTVARLGPRPR